MHQDFVMHVTPITKVVDVHQPEVNFTTFFTKIGANYNNYMYNELY